MNINETLGIGLQYCLTCYEHYLHKYIGLLIRTWASVIKWPNKKTNIFSVGILFPLISGASLILVIHITLWHSAFVSANWNPPNPWYNNIFLGGKCLLIYLNKMQQSRGSLYSWSQMFNFLFVVHNNFKLLFI